MTVIQESKMFHQTMSFFSDFTCNTQETELFATSFAINMQHQLQNVTDSYIFCLREHSDRPLRKHKAFSAGLQSSSYEGVTGKIYCLKQHLLTPATA